MPDIETCELHRMNKMQSEMADFAPGTTTTWQSRTNITSSDWCCHVANSTKHNTSYLIVPIKCCILWRQDVIHITESTLHITLLSEENWAMATHGVQKSRWNMDKWFLWYASRENDIQTDRHADHNTVHPFQSWRSDKINDNNLILGANEIYLQIEVSWGMICG